MHVASHRYVGVPSTDPDIDVLVTQPRGRSKGYYAPENDIEMI